MGLQYMLILEYIKQFEDVKQESLDYKKPFKDWF